MSTHPLSERWRQKATEDFRRCGATEAATTMEACADELDAYEIEHGLETLSLTEASVESGLSESQLARHLAAERIPNAGEKGHPRIRRKDLPRKIAPAPPPSDEVDLVGAVRKAQTPPLGKVG